MTTEETIEAAARALQLQDESFSPDEELDPMFVVDAMAALSTLRPGSRLPGGMVVVPVEPTIFMVGACLKTLNEGMHVAVCVSESDVKDAYRAMLSALEGK